MNVEFKNASSGYLQGIILLSEDLFLKNQKDSFKVSVTLDRRSSCASAKFWYNLPTLEALYWAYNYKVRTKLLQVVTLTATHKSTLLVGTAVYIM